MFPKPTKQQRNTEAEQEKLLLRAYRQIQSAKAIYRDNDQCVFCWFLLGKRVKRADIHHVYGRGRKAGDWREHYTNLLCVCRKHHPLPIQTPGAPSSALAYVESVLKMANQIPINPKFIHDGD